MILQFGVKPSWFNTFSTAIKKRPHLIPGTPLSTGDLRTYMISIPPLGDSVVPEMLLKVLEPYRKEGLYILCRVSDCENSLFENLYFWRSTLPILAFLKVAYLMMREPSCMLVLWIKVAPQGLPSQLQCLVNSQKLCFGYSCLKRLNIW